MTEEPRLQFARRGIAEMVLLTFVTAGFYMIYWLHSQTMIVNAHSSRQVDPRITTAAAVLFLASLAFVVTDAVTVVPQQLVLLRLCVDFGSGILVMGWTFLIRDEVNRLAGVDRGDSLWVSPFWCALFQPFYVQYKINQVIAARSAS